MNTVSLALFHSLSLSLCPLPLLTHLQSLWKILQKLVAHYCFPSPFSFYIFLNEAMVELIIREKPLTQFPGSVLPAPSTVAKAYKERKCFFMIRVLWQTRCSPYELIEGGIKRLYLLQGSQRLLSGLCIWHSQVSVGLIGALYVCVCVCVSVCVCEVVR